MSEPKPGLLEHIFGGNDEVQQNKICPLMAMAYTIAGVPNRVQEPVCIGPRCAWYIPVDEGLGECAVKRFTWP